MESDLISRSAVLDIINEERRFAEELRRSTFDSEDRAHNMGQLGCAIGLAREIKELPALDAVPVVRCKDCWKRGGYHCSMFYEEQTYNEDDGYDWIERDQTEDDGFCHCGERMEDSANVTD